MCYWSASSVAAALRSRERSSCPIIKINALRLRADDAGVRSCFCCVLRLETTAPLPRRMLADAVARAVDRHELLRFTARAGELVPVDAVDALAAVDVVPRHGDGTGKSVQGL